ncbi:hypothetical protein ACTQ34_14035 [Agathobaculum sp. LCP25S3_E8]|uniref:hypothetical protein n=1 Tax=Agathobaculum sp. LCP25S3_E8 TaxID=3438735 RepID=UPI003F926D3A
MKKASSNSEEMLLHIVWNVGAPLSVEISQRSGNATSGSIDYIHNILTSLLDKEILEICGFFRSGKNMSVKFSAASPKRSTLSTCSISTASLTKIEMALIKKQDEKGRGENTTSSLLIWSK